MEPESGPPVWGGSPPENGTLVAEGQNTHHPPQPKPLGVGVTLLFLFIFVIAMLASGLMALLVYAAFTDPFDIKTAAASGDVVILNYFFSVLFCAAVFALIFVISNYPPRQYLALNKTPLLVVGLWIAAGVAVSAGIDAALYLAGEDTVPDWMEQVYANTICFPCLIFVVVIIAPVVEEAIFRGFAYAGLAKGWGPYPAIAITGLVWTLLHAGQYGLVHLVMVFVLGMVLGAARWRTGSIYVPVAMHAVNNLLASLQVIFYS